MELSQKEPQLEMQPTQEGDKNVFLTYRSRETSWKATKSFFVVAVRHKRLKTERFCFVEMCPGKKKKKLEVFIAALDFNLGLPDMLH